MKVTVVDRESMKKAWGTPGPYTIITRKIEISDTCPKCGGPRGEPREERMIEDGDIAYISRWHNPCGHIDKYADVLREPATPPGEQE